MQPFANTIGIPEDDECFENVKRHIGLLRRRLSCSRYSSVVLFDLTERMSNVTQRISNILRFKKNSNNKEDIRRLIVMEPRVTLDRCVKDSRVKWLQSLWVRDQEKLSKMKTKRATPLNIPHIHCMMNFD